MEITEGMLEELKHELIAGMIPEHRGSWEYLMYRAEQMLADMTDEEIVALLESHGIVA